ncbi:MAG: crossover junction endodeoxyribonuclease RuvC, partial [Chitinivibrionales bacterium]|nr:crossover junction endodeoxyribonuclease RuvC [Chitinivibrionales bacterium]MBD3397101.1 crossover junction endodeoxyribonuclease RuvC [Chitinivibrionales bacterium]
GDRRPAVEGAGMTFLGVDPGTAITGYGVIRADGNTVFWVDSGIIRPPSGATLAEKLEVIYDGLCERIVSHMPSCVCVEQAFYGRNARTALVLGCARGLALLAARKSGAVVMEFSPTEIKKTVVGNGNAAKDQVSYMVQTLLSPGEKHAQADAYDALAAALCAFYHYRADSVIGR